MVVVVVVGVVVLHELGHQLHHLCLGSQQVLDGLLGWIMSRWHLVGFSRDKNKTDRPIGNKTSYPCTNNSYTTSSIKLKKTNKTSSQLWKLIGFRKYEGNRDYCLTSSSKTIGKRINGNIKVCGSHLKF